MNHLASDTKLLKLKLKSQCEQLFCYISFPSALASKTSEEISVHDGIESLRPDLKQLPTDHLYYWGQMTQLLAVHGIHFTPDARCCVRSEYDLCLVAVYVSHSEHLTYRFMSCGGLSLSL